MKGQTKDKSKTRNVDAWMLRALARLLREVAAILDDMAAGRPLSEASGAPTKGA